MALGVQVVAVPVVAVVLVVTVLVALFVVGAEIHGSVFRGTEEMRPILGGQSWRVKRERERVEVVCIQSQGF